MSGVTGLWRMNRKFFSLLEDCADGRCRQTHNQEMQDVGCEFKNLSTIQRFVMRYHREENKELT